MRDITALEVSQQHVELLPDREALALLNVNAILAAANVGAAVNALTVDSTAYASATQGIFVYQS